MTKRYWTLDNPLLYLLLALLLLLARWADHQRTAPPRPAPKKATPGVVLALGPPTEEQNWQEAGVTRYQPTRAQTDATPGVTASGAKVPQHWPGARWVGVSHDLLARHGGPLHWGDTIEIADGPTRGRWCVQDLMHRRYRRRLDVMMPGEGGGLGRVFWRRIAPKK